MKIPVIILVFFCGCSLLATEFMLKLPVPSQVQVNESQGIITIEASFKPSRALNAQMNRKIDRKHAERICVEGLRRFFDVGTSSLSYSQLQSVGSPSYTEEKAVYVFTLPKSAVKIIPGQQNTQNTIAKSSVKQTSVSSNASSATTQGSKVITTIPSTSLPVQTENNRLSETTVTVSSASASFPLSRQIITDAEIEKLPAMGYSVRLMKDCQTMIEIKNEELEQCRQQADFDTLKKLQTLFEECRDNFDAEKIKLQHKFDPQLTGGDLVKISDYVASEGNRLRKDIYVFFTILREKIIKELLQSKMDLGNVLKNNIDDETIKDEISIVNECLVQINQIVINP